MKEKTDKEREGAHERKKEKKASNQSEKVRMTWPIFHVQHRNYMYSIECDQIPNRKQSETLDETQPFISVEQLVTASAFDNTIEMMM